MKREGRERVHEMVPAIAPVAPPLVQPATMLIPPPKVVTAELEEEPEREPEVEEKEWGGQVAGAGAAGAPPAPAGGIGPRVQRTSLPELFLMMATHEQPDGGLLVDDDIETLTTGQMRKREFLRQLRGEVTSAADTELRVGRTAAVCSSIAGLQDERNRPPAARSGGGSGGGGGGSGAAPARKAIGPSLGRVDGNALVAQLGPGRPLDGNTRARMESGFGHRFANVRIYADDTAADLNPVGDAGDEYEDVQLQADGGLQEDFVHNAAAHGIAGGSGALPFLDQIQASFGDHDVSSVQAHVGGPASDASAAMGATAYATGNHVAFAGAPDLHTAAHEAAHVVQQRGGVQLNGGVGEVGDPHERHADQVADAVVRGESAADLLSVPSSAVAVGSVQRFSAREHKRMGDDGANAAWTELDEDYSLPFGDVVALAGDHFSSIEQMRTFAKNRDGGANSRLEIEWARKWKLNANVAWNDSDPKFREARKAQEGRYAKLAAGNTDNYEGNASHFLNPKEGDSERSTADKATDFEERSDDQTDGTKGAEWTRQLGGVGAVASYRVNHLKAIVEAAKAGRQKKPIAEALAVDAFACHYLTDAFAGGHVRTERLSIKNYWDAKVPMFSTNLAGYMSQEIARYLRSNEADVKIDLELPLVDTGLPGASIYPDADNFSEMTVTNEAHDKISKVFREQASISFGDVISGALHDRDNAEGVSAHVYGQKEVLRGDGFAYEEADDGDAPNNTAKLATQAVALSVRDIYRAKELGAKMGPAEVVAELFDERERLFPAEEFLPTLTKEDQADSRTPEISWKVESAAALMNDPAMAAAITQFMKAKGGEIRSLESSFPGAQGKALESIAKRMEVDSIATLFQVIHWTPGDGGVADQKWRARQYIDTAKGVKGGFASLTGAQRLSLIRDLMEGDEDQLQSPQVWDLLTGMDAREASHVIPAVGWRRLRDYFGADFEKRFPQDTFGT